MGGGGRGNITSFVCIFTMEIGKDPTNQSLIQNVLFMNRWPFSNLLWHPLSLLEYDRLSSYFFLWVFQKSVMLKENSRWEMV